MDSMAESQRLVAAIDRAVLETARLLRASYRLLGQPIRYPGPGAGLAVDTAPRARGAEERRQGLALPK
jgi:hypothetical protein